MKGRAWPYLPVALLGGWILAGCAKQSQSFGTPLAASNVLSVSEVVQAADAYLTRRLTVESRIETVCQSAGCWCFLSDGAEQLYVSMTTFSLPPSAAGRRCRVQGELLVRDDRLTLLASGVELLAE